MTYGNFLRGLLKYSLSSAFALGLLVGLLIMLSGAEGEISIDIGFEGWDGLYFIAGFPLLMTLLFLLVSPLAWACWRLAQRLRNVIRSSS